MLIYTYLYINLHKFLMLFVAQFNTLVNSRSNAPLDTEETEIAANFAAINSYNGPLRLSSIFRLILGISLVTNPSC